MPAEGLVHITTLRDDIYDYDRAGHCLTGRRSGRTIRLGDPVRVAVARVDVDRRELDLRLVEGASQQGRRPAGKPAKDRGRPSRSDHGGRRSDRGKRDSQGDGQPRDRDRDRRRKKR
jgi:ribonuclease R